MSKNTHGYSPSFEQAVGHLKHIKDALSSLDEISPVNKKDRAVAMSLATKAREASMASIAPVLLDFMEKYYSSETEDRWTIGNSGTLEIRISNESNQAPGELTKARILKKSPASDPSLLTIDITQPDFMHKITLYAAKKEVMTNGYGNGTHRTNDPASSDGQIGVVLYQQGFKNSLGDSPPSMAR